MRVRLAATRFRGYRLKPESSSDAVRPLVASRNLSGVRRQSRTGFTLIELLVVIAIIAILAAILVPVVQAALDRGRFMHCTSNIGQLGKAINMFATDHEGLVPSPNWGTRNASGWLYWRGRMDKPEYVETGQLWPYVGSRRVYRCPADPQPDHQDTSIPNRPTNSRMITSFCMNGSVIAYGRNMSFRGGLYQTFLIEQFAASDIVFWEPDESKAGGWWWDGSNYPSEGISSRHFDRASVANFDGSAHGMGLVDYYDMANPNANQRVPPGRNRLWNVPGSPDGS